MNVGAGIAAWAFATIASGRHGADARPDARIVRKGRVEPDTECCDRSFDAGASPGNFQADQADVPASATIEAAAYQYGLDDNGRVILVMPATDWEAMRAAPPFNTAPDRPYIAEHADMLGANDGWWHPRDDPPVVAVQVPLRGLKGGDEGLNVGFAKAGAKRVRVYIFWFET